MAVRKAIRQLRKEEFESTVAKNVLSSVLGAKDARFTAGEKHSDLVWLHLMEATTQIHGPTTRTNGQLRFRSLNRLFEARATFAHDIYELNEFYFL